MTRRCEGSGLLVAGLIVTLVGLVVVLTATLAIPRYWTTLVVGVALLLAGVVRRGLRPREGS